MKHRIFWAYFVTTRYSKAGVWWWLYTMNSNLNLAKPFIILIMRHWKGQAAVKFLNQSKVIQSWCEKRRRAKPTFPPTQTQKQVVVTILEPIYQSQPCKTIHHTYNETLKGSSCCEILEQIQTYSILVWNIGFSEPTLSPPATQKPGCGDGYTQWTQISTLQNHSLYL